MIPPSIHQLWIDPNARAGKDLGDREPAALPADVAANCLAWRLLHPNFGYKLWRLGEVARLARLQDRADVCAAITACRFPAMQADIARLFLLEMDGGFWVDLKLHPLMPFLDRLIFDDLVVTEHFPKDNLQEPNGFLINSFIGARPYHPCISAALDGAVRNVRRRMAGSIFYVTGSPVLMEAIGAVPDRGKYRMLDHQSVWDHLFEIRGGSYNEGGLHWSQRQERESAFRA
ncbi:hypothetical protein AiwAL_07320 [Acidiphilium sp. AL]|uniref:Uncharacterized protein n=1 Tax=Acidiphilium iwatense TaxID=768198 RepID=A0ABS9DWX0_9PROT|nr:MULTISPECIES: hypothetical protein [Acidiphilium]MCF3946300.1 hypothetical protein [Acidiphilium iwatense]MCU4159915.1 hypothetical protein [Acidiphilium sp. AL]